jgi:glutamate-ammonia-ligase adenylyltransferase
MAGDMAFGQTALDALGPFIWRREVNPSLAEEMASLVARARVEISVDAERDLKHGHGGIREVEFFTQSLQLIWGGREPLVRSRNTIDALRRLRARGLVTDREGRDMADAYMTLRRLEHRIQFATGQQTHTLPTEPDLLRRIARSLGFGSSDDMLKDLVRTRERVAERFQSLAPSSPESGSIAPPNLPLERFFLALDDRDETALLAAITEAATAEGAALPSPLHFGAFPSPDLPRHLLALARRPDFPLGANSRDKFPHLVTTLLEALGDAADPEQASRLLAAFFARLGAPSVYARALAEEPRTARRLSSLFGASAFLGQALVAHPDLVDRLLFIRETPSPDSVQTAVDEEFQRLAPGDEGDADMFVGALRRAKAAVLMEVGLADLAGELSTRAATQILSSLADITLDRCLQFALHEKGLTATKGIAILAMGKLGGREIGYGSDLDIFFVHDGESDDDAERFARIAQRVLRLVSSPHGEGPGYELDVRLRPSGNQGVLVVSRNHFAKYHGLDGSTPSGQDWERQALIKARYCAGDPELGTQVLALAAEAAYERGAPLPADLLRIRTRMEKELAGERTGRSGKARYDLKLGKGGLVDVEFAIQWLQMRHGHDLRVRSTDTETALAALETHGYLEPRHALALREGYQFLRRLEQRLRVLHGTSANLLEEDAEGLALLARRMGMRDGPRGPAKAALLARYRTITQDVRNTYLAILGVAPPKSDED